MINQYQCTDLTPQTLISLVEKIICQSDGTIHNKYSFVNALQEP